MTCGSESFGKIVQLVFCCSSLIHLCYFTPSSLHLLSPLTSPPIPSHCQPVLALPPPPPPTHTHITGLKRVQCWCKMIANDFVRSPCAVCGEPPNGGTGGGQDWEVCLWPSETGAGAPGLLLWGCHESVSDWTRTCQKFLLHQCW